MTREQANELLPAITHFASGGNLWCYDTDKKEWFMLNDHELNWDIPNKACYIIEDRHFEARKAFALGEEIENQYGGTYRMKNELLISHSDYLPFSKENIDRMDYKINFKEPVYEYQWIHKLSDKYGYKITKEFMTEFVADNSWIKFEPSKRIRK